MKTTSQYTDRKLLTGILILILTLTLISSLRLGTSSIYITLANLEMDRWTTEPDRAESEWANVESILSYAKKIYPDNPSISSNIGRLYRNNDLSTSLTAYNESSKLRPSHGLTWATIAELKSRLNQIDTDFSVAITNASRLGPWEPATQYRTVSAGLHVWPQLTSTDRLIIRNTAIRGMQSPRNLHNMGRLLKREGFLSLVCPQLPKTRRYYRYCKTN